MKNDITRRALIEDLRDAMQDDNEISWAFTAGFPIISDGLRYEAKAVSIDDDTQSICIDAIPYNGFRLECIAFPIDKVRIPTLRKIVKECRIRRHWFNSLW